MSGIPDSVYDTQASFFIWRTSRFEKISFLMSVKNSVILWFTIFVGRQDLGSSYNPSIPNFLNLITQFLIELYDLWNSRAIVRIVSASSITLNTVSIRSFAFEFDFFCMQTLILHAIFFTMCNKCLKLWMFLVFLKIVKIFWRYFNLKVLTISLSNLRSSSTFMMLVYFSNLALFLRSWLSIHYLSYLDPMSCDLLYIGIISLPWWGLSRYPWNHLELLHKDIIWRPSSRQLTWIKFWVRSHQVNSTLFCSFYIGVDTCLENLYGLQLSGLQSSCHTRIIFL